MVRLGGRGLPLVGEGDPHSCLAGEGGAESAPGGPGDLSKAAPAEKLGGGTVRHEGGGRSKWIRGAGGEAYGPRGTGKPCLFSPALPRTCKETHALRAPVAFPGWW